MRISEAQAGEQIEIKNIFDIGGNKYQAVTKTVESDLVYPLLRGRDVQRWAASPEISIILPQDVSQQSRAYDESTLRRRFPRTLEYFEVFRSELLARSHYKAHFRAQGAPYYSTYDVGPYTFDPYKVVWREQSSPFMCAVVSSVEGKIVVPDHKLMLVPFKDAERAHYVCALLNSKPSQFIVQAYTISIQQSTHILKNIRVPDYDGTNDTHRELAQLSKLCHQKVAAGIDVNDIEDQIDMLAAELWGLKKAELEDIKDSLEEMQ